MIQADAESRSWLLGKVRAVREELEKMEATPELLDPLVDAAASEEASAHNNGGVPSQVEYLLRNGWTPDDILFQARVEQENEEVPTPP